MTISSIHRSIKESYAGDDKSTFDGYVLSHKYFYRPLSFWPSAVLVRMGFTANAVTMLKLITLALSWIIMVYGGPKWLVIGSVVYLISFFMDFCDGNVARYHQSSSMFGKLFDGNADNFSSFIYIIVPVYTLTYGQNLFVPSIEIGLGIVYLFVNFMLVYNLQKIEIFKAQRLVEGIHLFPQAQASTASQEKSFNFIQLLKVLKSIQLGISDLNPVVLVVLSLIGVPSYFMIFGFFVFTVPAAVECVFWVLWSYRNLR